MKLAWIIAAAAVTAPCAWAAPQAPTAVRTQALPRARPAAEGAALTCAVSSPKGRPLTFTPRIGLTARPVSARGNLQLTGCLSGDGSAPYLRSGWVTLKSVGQASCTSARHVHGTLRITWFGVDGRPVGTSEVRTRADRLATQSPADSFLAGTVVSGPLARERVGGGITPAMGILGCATGGLSRLPAAGRLTFG
ncbi:hypothetical protein ACFFV7_07620 [Nonomuraea spiralis]|uniref:Uncharacterized protein n=1 Tax=Nonomuraea spiralis TaxID=46182 RepID=A0ABV5IAG2_9ACTN|nr:hypothetical protein [Nonomuraea spiralis]GGS76556.1 hypothetical protein GCM10010176_019610 [Nonomuraea spiralis]